LVAAEEVVDDAIGSGQEFADDLVKSLEDPQDGAGGGSMTSDSWE
jgi:hypothetical protein